MSASSFADLFAAATAARANAYAPYSKFHVGAAILDAAGRIHAGANVENAAYPQGQCAEASAIGAMIAAGGRRIAEIVVIGGEPGDEILCTPCGGCRQRLREFMSADAKIHVAGPEGLRRSFTMDQLLPCSFGPENLNLVNV